MNFCISLVVMALWLNVTRVYCKYWIMVINEQFEPIHMFTFTKGGLYHLMGEKVIYELTSSELICRTWLDSKSIHLHLSAYIPIDWPNPFPIFLFVFTLTISDMVVHLKKDFQHSNIILLRTSFKDTLQLGFLNLGRPA